MIEGNEQKPGLIRRFFSGIGWFLRSLRELLVNLVFLLFILVLLTAFWQKDVHKMPNDVALIINPAGILVDQLSYVDPMAYVLQGESDFPQETLVRDLTKTIKAAATDKHITSLVMQLDELEFGGVSKMLEVSAALKVFKASGKKIYIYGDSFSQDQYLLAAHADEIFLHPMGEVELTGFGVYRNYFKDALDKLEIDFHVFRVGEYKSAMEPFLRQDMSEQDRQSNLTWLNSLWGNYLQAVTTARGIKTDVIDRFINKNDEVLAAVKGNAAQAALNAGLITAIKGREETNEFLLNELGEDENGDYRGIDYRDYLAMGIKENKSENKVGLIVASGEIVDGEAPSGEIGGDTLAGFIREAIDDEAVKAVVLRVDSGGGSAFASEVIREQILALRETGKPLIISMGSVAASGGYWISADADEIWSTPTTLTGSIGIFGAFPTVQKSLQKLGINTDGVGTTTVAGGMRIDRALDPITERAIQSSVEFGYQQFIGVVSKGRNLQPAAVEAIAQGRVWSGADALSNKLVDKLGGLDEAIASAAKLASLDTYQVITIEETLDPRQLFLKEVMQSGAKIAATLGVKLGVSHSSTFAPLLKAAEESSAIKTWMTAMTKDFSQVLGFNDPRGLYLYCSTCKAP
jgi:protease-4